VNFDDWLPWQKRDTKWNRWTSEESMMQFFGTLEKEEELHTEFKLFLSKEKIIMLCNIKGLKERKKQKNSTLNFRSTSEKPDEKAVELIWQTFSGKK